MELNQEEMVHWAALDQVLSISSEGGRAGRGNIRVKWVEMAYRLHLVQKL